MVTNASLQQRQKRAVALLFALLLLATLFFFGAPTNGSYNGGVGNPDLPLFHGSNHLIEAVLWEPNDPAKPLGFPSVAFPADGIAPIDVAHILAGTLSHPRELPDYRKEIERFNPHFFNGSNYKESSLSIS